MWVCVVDGDRERGERKEGKRYSQVSITADKLISNHKELTSQSIPNEGTGFCLKTIFSKAALMFRNTLRKALGGIVLEEDHPIKNDFSEEMSVHKDFRGTCWASGQEGLDQPQRQSFGMGPTQCSPNIPI